MTRIINYETLSNAPLFATFLRVYADMLEKGHCNQFAWNKETRVVAAVEEDGTPSAFIVYSINLLTKAMWIYMAYTAPEHRKRGLYRRLHTYLEEECRKHYVRQIGSTIYAANPNGLAAAKALGKDIESFRVIKRITGVSK